MGLQAEAPLAIAEPHGEGPRVGLGDLRLESRLLLWHFSEERTVGSAGLAVGLPTGSPRRRLGGDTVVEPYLTTGLAVGTIDLIGEVGYATIVGGPGAPAQTLRTSVAAGYRVGPRVTPSMELGVLTPTRSGGAGHERAGRMEAYLTPGLGIRFGDGRRMRAGVELPVTPARAFDYRLLATFAVEF